MTAYIIDTETSQQEKPEVIELATLAIEIAPNGLLTESGQYSERFRPKGPISCGARAVHHILDVELEACADSATCHLPQDTEYVIGHNVDFDWQVMGSPNVKRICTLALVRRLWPQVEGHSLSACMYRISNNHELTRERLRNAHSAEHDVCFTYELLEHILSKSKLPIDSVETLWKISEDVRIPLTWTFGKHKGKRIEEADKGYLNWCIKQPDMDEYVKEACRRVLREEY